MSLKIYNHQTRKKEGFVPLEAGKIGLYTCGITAYDLCHVGHARSAVVFDVITRYLRYLGFVVTYVRNFTDVDDKIIDRAHREGTTIEVIADRYIAEHDRDMAALGIEPPTFAPRATEHIEGMIALIEVLMDKGMAYQVGGDVYFSVEKFEHYGKLSGRTLEEMMAGARIDVNEKKENPYDFVLWKASKEGEPWWESPWGKGRPGWHLECSVMSQHYLGDTFDIHGGGEDLVFPHHENEIAQSEGATGKPLARYWVHNGFVRVNHEKMSKSLGNFFTIQDILKEIDAEVLRLFFLQSHYRSPVDFSDMALAEARQGMLRFYTTFQRLRDVIPTGVTGGQRPSVREGELAEQLQGLRKRFCEAMDDDFNTARAIGHLFETIRLINACLDEQKGGLSAALAGQAQALINETGEVLGLFRKDPEVYLRLDRDREAAKRGIVAAEVEELIVERRLAREAKDWAKADAIRQGLAARGVLLKDTSTATVWTFA